MSGESSDQFIIYRVQFYLTCIVVCILSNVVTYSIDQNFHIATYVHSLTHKSNHGKGCKWLFDNCGQVLDNRFKSHIFIIYLVIFHTATWTAWTTYTYMWPGIRKPCLCTQNRPLYINNYLIISASV